MGKGLKIHSLTEKNWSCSKEFPCENFLYKTENRKLGYDYYLFFYEITPAKEVVLNTQ